MQVVSDLHLEFYTDPHDLASVIQSVVTNKCASSLFVAGDLGHPFEPHYEQALGVWSKHFAHILLIVGNHEFYNTQGRQRTVVQCIEQARRVASSFSNVHFLHDSSIDLDIEQHKGTLTDTTTTTNTTRIRVIGTPLWYHTTSRNRYMVVQALNDYKYIFVEQSSSGSSQRDSSSLSSSSLSPRVACIQPEDVNKWYKAHVTYLFRAISKAKSDGIPCIVMTHHLPSMKLLAPQYKFNELNCAFASTLDDIVSASPVIAIIAGHSHASVQTHVGSQRSVPAILNAVGYMFEGRLLHALKVENSLAMINVSI